MFNVQCIYCLYQNIHENYIHNYFVLGANIMNELFYKNLKNWFLNFGLLKSCVFFFVLYLLFEEFVSFVFVKPTQSSIGETNLIPEHNPKILICMTPAYEVDGFR